ncbi:MAG: flavodoxin family protein [Methanomicrobiales archaeon]|nr:flavodoxin family protein [Methanomicrobiales archaeon]
MSTKVIGLLGSPLSEGNTAQLLDQALKGASEAGCDVERIEVPFLKIKPCMEIFYCVEHETCRIQDDMQEMYRKFSELDGLIIATPVMTMGVPGALKSFMDRFQVFFMAKYLRKKPLVAEEKRTRRRCLLISISGMNIPDVFTGLKMTVQAFCHIVDCRYADELLIRDMDHIREIRTRPDLLKTAHDKGFELGKALVARE